MAAYTPFVKPTSLTPYHHCFTRCLARSFNVDISSLLKSTTDEEGQSTDSPPSVCRSESVLSSVATSVAPLPPQPRPVVPAKRPLTSQGYSTQSPAKKQSKWSPEEDSRIIQLRQDGMKWEDISKHLPGRSAISCRLHYQNYLERRSEWDEDRKNKLARLYERFRADMWARVAEEMVMPWRAVEAMHWQMGEHEMAKRAGVTPFSLANAGSGAEPSTLLPPRSQYRHGTPAPRLRRDSMAREASLTGPQQLPSLAELTAGLPAFSAPPPHPPDLFHQHQLYDHPRGRNSRFR
ncbi:hypothetical protein A1O1_01715 [Capronia coronata CBS 617.96]|uniref:MYB DNA-binding domain-containing protein n=1 Tax=Capronia coronata CBS 617.96 TaxID=1182541 RepID=W9YL78_9EURO|nr:uncharacterized protein A1O1_01715 [Capronia coronata CBS 617.96]EXJ93323.1 hypothetical protein A1O1_01715 [Capronia coronata CBS 617.96]